MYFRKNIEIMIPERDLEMKASEADPDYEALARMRASLPPYHGDHFAKLLIFLACRPEEFAVEIEEVCSLVPPPLRGVEEGVEISVETMRDLVCRAQVFVLHLLVDKTRIPKPEPSPAAGGGSTSTLDISPRRRLTVRGGS